MKLLLLWLAILPATSIAQTPMPVPLANDNYENAASLRGTFIEGSVWLTNATIEVQEPFADSWSTRTAWYLWRAPTNGVASFSAVGAGGGSIQSAVYYGDWPNLRLITYATAPNFTLRFPVAAQQSISIQVGGRPPNYSNS